MKVTQYNQSLRITPEGDMEEKLVLDFLSKQYTYKRSGGKGPVRFEKADKYFYHIVYKNEYVLIDTMMKDFFYYVFSNGLPKERLTVGLRETEVETTIFNMKQDYPYRDEQEFFVEGMIDESRHHRVIVEAETGYGKTFMAAKAITMLNRGVLVYILPTYISKWIDDITTYLDITEDDIYIIQGGSSLKSFLASEEKYKIVIASADTMRVYFENTSNSTVINDEYAIQPENLMEKKNLGIMLSDETHLSFNNIYNAVLMLDPKRVIALSATLITKDSQLEKFHKYLFPKESRLALEVYKRFVIIENINYHIHTNKLIRTSNGYGYNHKKFEAFILRNKRLAIDYMGMVIYYIDKHYINRNRGGDKCLVYASSLEMIDYITDYLKDYYGDLDVRKYVGRSNYEDALEPDIRVSHQQSLGAAIDIKNLIYTINTINIDSISALLQMIGRLRENDIDVIFTQLLSTNIPQHKKYVRGNRKYLAQRVKTIKEDTYNKTLYA